MVKLRVKPTCCNIENDCVSRIIISPDSLPTTKYDTTLDEPEFRRIVSIVTTVGKRCNSLSACFLTKSLNRFKCEMEFRMQDSNFISNQSKIQTVLLTCCSSRGKLSRCCEIAVSWLKGIDLKLSMISGNLSDFSYGNCSIRIPT